MWRRRLLLLRETNICLAPQRMRLQEKGLTAQQTEWVEIRYSPAATDTACTLTQESQTHTVPHTTSALSASLLPSYFLSCALEQAQVECLYLDSTAFLSLLQPFQCRASAILSTKQNTARAFRQKMCDVKSSDYRFTCKTLINLYSISCLGLSGTFQGTPSALYQSKLEIIKNILPVVCFLMIAFPTVVSQNNLPNGVLWMMLVCISLGQFTIQSKNQNFEPAKDEMRDLIIINILWHTESLYGNPVYETGMSWGFYFLPLTAKYLICKTWEAPRLLVLLPVPQCHDPRVQEPWNLIITQTFSS